MSMTCMNCHSKAELQDHMHVQRYDSASRCNKGTNCSHAATHACMSSSHMLFSSVMLSVENIAHHAMIISNDATWQFHPCPPDIMWNKEVSQEVGLASARDCVPAMMPQGWGGLGHASPLAISAPSSTPALPYSNLADAKWTLSS